MDQGSDSDQTIHGSANGFDSFSVVSGALRPFVSGPDRTAQVGSKRPAADRNHFVYQVKIDHRLNGGFLASVTVTTDSDPRADLVLEDFRVFCDQRPAAIQYRLQLPAYLSLIDRAPQQPGVGPFQFWIEILYIVLLDTPLSLSDAMIAVDAETDLLASSRKIFGFDLIFFLCVIQGRFNGEIGSAEAGASGNSQKFHGIGHVI